MAGLRRDIGLDRAAADQLTHARHDLILIRRDPQRVQKPADVKAVLAGLAGGLRD